MHHIRPLHLQFGKLLHFIAELAILNHILPVGIHFVAQLIDGKVLHIYLFIQLRTHLHHFGNNLVLNFLSNLFGLPR